MPDSSAAFAGVKSPQDDAMRLILDATSELWIHYPVGTTAAVVTVLFALASKFRRGAASRTHARALVPAQRQLWFTALFIGGVETVSNLNVSLQCGGLGATPQEMMNHFILLMTSSAVLLLILLCAGALGQSVAAARLLLVPPAGAAAAALSIAALIALHVCSMQTSGLAMRYVPAIS